MRQSVYQDISGAGIPGYYPVHVYGSFIACHPNHGCGRDSIDASGTVSCC